MPQDSWLARRLVGIAILLVLLVGLALTYRALAPTQPVTPLPTSPITTPRTSNSSITPLPKELWTYYTPRYTSHSTSRYTYGGAK